MSLISLTCMKVEINLIVLYCKPDRIRYYSDVLRHLAIKSVMSRNKRLKALIFSSPVTRKKECFRTFVSKRHNSL